MPQRHLAVSQSCSGRRRQSKVIPATAATPTILQRIPSTAMHIVGNTQTPCMYCAVKYNFSASTDMRFALEPRDMSAASAARTLTHLLNTAFITIVRASIPASVMYMYLHSVRVAQRECVSKLKDGGNLAGA